ncbi:GntR family transcriptional regulator [Marinivivus vitaminiproducens]|uniref:GntR family transcriptional regulator n=1 Tax=Marinivivus vitaminiproducens TaxID=3035935 RepID=UPI0027A28E5D|nr:GntR family transcriptional regulator [Geminicoccaceae bacterium SCSIO 64248]
MSTPRDLPAYVQIANALRASIRDGHLAPGTVLLEGPLAAIFGSSRSPVKGAIAQLLEEGLLRRFEGRGAVVGTRDTPVLRVPLTAAMLGLDDRGAEIPKVWAWQRFYEEVERELIYRSVFGRFRVNELELARHHGIGRTVARDILIQAQSTGIVTKAEKAHWFIVPLGDKRLDDLYAMRALLEPALLRTAAGRIAPDSLRTMRRRLATAQAAYPEVGGLQMDAIETDLHVTCLGHGDNPEMLEALKRTRCILISGKHILGAELAFPPNDPFLDDHDAILRALEAGDGEAAAAALSRHLAAARPKVIERLARFRASYAVPPLGYVV